MLDKHKTVEVLEALANGIDPNTGEVFPTDSPYQNVEITRALFQALEAVKNYKPKKAQPARQGSKWTEQEDTQLQEAFRSGEKLTELAKKHQRSSGAIRSRLIKKGLIQE